jgi:hypothetical protein
MEAGLLVLPGRKNVTLMHPGAHSACIYFPDALQSVCLPGRQPGYSVAPQASERKTL